MENFDKIKQICAIKGNFKCVKIFDMRDNLLMYIEAKDSEKLQQSLFKYIDLDPQMLKLAFKVEKNSNDYYRHTFDFTKPINVTVLKDEEFTSQQQQQPSFQNQTIYSQEEVDKMIVNGVNQRLEAEQVKLQKKEYDRKVKEIETISGKFTIIMETVLPKIMNSLMPQNTTPLTVQGTDNMQQNNNELLTVDESLDILLQHLDQETLSKMAKKVQKDPNVVNIIKLAL